MLQRRNAPDEGLIVAELNNPAAPHRQITLAITADAVRCRSVKQLVRPADERRDNRSEVGR